MKKRLVNVLLAGAMMISMCACGSGAGTDSQAAGTTGGNAAGTEAVEAAGSAAAGKGLEGMTIGFSQCDNSSNWKIVETESIQEKAKELGVNLIYTDASGNIAKQASDIEDMVSQGVEYIIVAPQEEDGLQSALKSAMDAGIGVILIDRSINGEAGNAYTTKVMSDFVWEAEQVAQRVIEVTGGEGNVVIIQGTQGATSTTERQKGFMDAIADTDLKVISDQVANYSMPKAQEVMENVLQAQGNDIDIVYCHGADMAMGAIAAIKAAGFEPGKDMQVVCVDASKDAMEALIAGELLCTCSCSPYFGEVTFDLIGKMAAGETVEASYINEDTLYDVNNADVSLGY
uniref:ABC transporter substrate-binding protein n=1 Tax=Enterocloster hominis (ex Hitch et al. 2024) TaxID=1917870 RepID=UPI00103044C7|nr:ABC transporter substrate-binding protein [Lachnoclostridium pacaense]